MKGKTLLLVEDEAIIAMDTARRLEKYGYEVTRASSGDFVLNSTIEMALGLSETEAVLRESEAELHALYQHAPTTILLVDEHLRVRRSNLSSQNEIDGNDGPVPAIGEALRCVHALTLPEGCGSGPDCRSCAIRNTVQSAVHTRRAVQNREATITRLVDDHTERYWVLLTVVPFEVQSAPLFVVSILDISEKKRLQSELVRQDERFTGLAAAVSALVWESERDGRCVYFNDRWLEYTGRTLKDEVGDGWLEGVHRDDVTTVRDRYRVALAEESSFELTYRLRGADGRYRWVLDTGVPKTDECNRFCGFIGAATLVDNPERITTQRETAYPQR